MDVKERRPYCSLTKSRREKERRYTNSSADNEECRVPTQKSYSSSETLKAFDHDSSRLLYGNRVKDLVHREADEYTRQGQNFTLRQLGVCESATRRGVAFCAEMGLPHRGYSISAGSDADTENEAVMSPEHAMRLWGRGVKSGRSSCLSSRSNSALTLTDTEHESKSDSDSETFICIPNVRVILKGLAIYNQELSALLRETAENQRGDGYRAHQRHLRVLPLQMKRRLGGFALDCEDGKDSNFLVTAGLAFADAFRRLLPPLSASLLKKSQC
nr:teneurin-3-like [Meriones unguiculatus]